jgi:hypothetical protein
MSDKRHNGWTNYETWAAKAWIDNLEDSYLQWKHLARSSYLLAAEDQTFTKMENAAFRLRDMLKERHEALCGEQPVTGLFSDLLNSALAEINWQEIAESLLDGMDE